MMKLTIASFALCLALPLAACNNKSASAAAAAPTTTTTATSPAATAQPAGASAAVGDDPAVPRLAVGTKARCAVSGEDFTVAANTVQVTYAGKRYAFCCADCQPTFAKNPAKYAHN